MKKLEQLLAKRAAMDEKIAAKKRVQHKTTVKRTSIARK